MQDFRPTLLHHVLELAPFEGWSDFALCEAARLTGISEAEARQAFGGGINECIAYYFAQVDEQMQAKLPEKLLAEKRVPERIEALVMERFLIMQPHREAVRRAASMRLLPWNTPDALRSLFSMTDRMWKLAGDRSTDFNYYTKRMTLATVYVPTFLYWLTDNTADLSATRQFLKNRLAGVAEFGKKKKKILSTLQSFSTYARR